MPKKCYIISGEPSGDLHASNMIRELKALGADLDYRYWGGDLMAAQTGKPPVKHIRDLAFMGFVEVIKNLRTILNNIKFCKEDILAYKPDVLILVDYPGFNLRIADWAKKQGILVYYYISPTIWAWKENRVEIIKRSVDRFFVILPFEVEVYKKHNYHVDYVGHPLLDAIEQQKQQLPSRGEFIRSNNLPDKPLIAVLPGSRKQEIDKMLALMLNMAKQYPGYKFVIAGTGNLPKEVYQPAFDLGISVVFNQTYALLHNAHAGIIKSGTSTLEAALFSLPQVICYKGGAVSYAIAKAVVGDRIKYIGLPNLIMNRPISKELIQGELTEANLKKELDAILQGPAREQMLADDRELQQLLGNSGASKKVAQLIMHYLNEDL